MYNKLLNTSFFVIFREKETDNSKTEGDHLVAIVDCDDMSLVSYNSIRDCTPSATPRTVPTVQSHPGQLPQSASQDLKVMYQSIPAVLMSLEQQPHPLFCEKYLVNTLWWAHKS